MSNMVENVKLWNIKNTIKNFFYEFEVGKQFHW